MEPPPPTRRTSPPAWVRWLAWGLYVPAWTVALLVRNPLKNVPDPQLAYGVFLFSKAVHVSAYAVWASLTGWLRARPVARVVLLLVMLVHAVVTEILQHLLPTGRTGSPGDVALDYAGIVIGIGLTWRWWRQPAGRETAGGDPGPGIRPGRTPE